MRLPKESIWGATGVAVTLLVGLSLWPDSNESVNDSASPTTSLVATPILDSSTTTSSTTTLPTPSSSVASSTTVKKASSAQTATGGGSVATAPPGTAPSTTWPVNPPPCALIPESEWYYRRLGIEFSLAIQEVPPAWAAPYPPYYPYYYFGASRPFKYSWNGEYSIEEKRLDVVSGMKAFGVLNVKGISSAEVVGQFEHYEVVANLSEWGLVVWFITPDCSINS